jgi:hypothetical protein
MKKLTILALFLPFLGFSQVPGYMGKRLSFGYEAIMGQAGTGILNMWEVNIVRTALTVKGKPRPFLAIETRHGLVAEYVLSKSFALQGGIQYQRYGDFAFDKANDEINYDQSILKTDSFHLARITTFRVGLIFSKKNYISPHGRYVGWDFQLSKGKYDKLANKNTIAQFESLFVATCLDFGLRRIYADKIIVDGSLGFGLNVPITGKAIYGGDPEKESYYGFGIGPMFATNLFRAKIGVRYLL